MRKILLLLLLLPLIGIGQSRKKQIIKLNHQLDSLYNINYSLNSVIKKQETTYLNVISNNKKEIESLNNHILSLNKENNNLNLEITSLKNKIETLKKQLNSPYRLSKGIIDHRLFSFVQSEKFKELGKKDITKFKNVNNIQIDSNLVTDFNNFFDWGGACVDWSLVYIKDIYYFKAGKVLIIHVYYPGDFESSSSDTYVYYLYDEDLLKFQEVFATDAGNFEYNYETNYFFTISVDECSWESGFYIVDQNLKYVLSAYSMDRSWETMLDDLEMNDYTCSWGDNNRILIKNRNNKLMYMIGEDTPGNWILMNIR